MFGHLQVKDVFPRKEVKKRSMFTFSTPFPSPALTGLSLGQYQSIYLASLNCTFIKGRKKFSKHSVTPGLLVALNEKDNSQFIIQSDFIIQGQFFQRPHFQPHENGVFCTQGMGVEEKPHPVSLCRGGSLLNTAGLLRDLPFRALV